MYKTILTTHCSFDIDNKTVYITLNSKVHNRGREYAGLGSTIWQQYKKNWEWNELLITNENTTMMPLPVFEALHDYIITLPKLSRSPYLRLYLYFYFHCHANSNDFGISIERLCILLKSDSEHICRRIKDFIDAGFLSRMGMYNADAGRPYRYYIPLHLTSDIFR